MSSPTSETDLESSPEPPQEIPVAEIVDETVPSPHGQPCNECGSPIEQEDHFCPGCGKENPGYSASAETPQKKFQCQNCGSKVTLDRSVRSYTCPFCDSNYVVETELKGGPEPEFIIGFSLSPEEAQKRFRSWIEKDSFFRPSSLKQVRLKEKLTGVYLPFWSFSMLAESDWAARIGEYWYRTETYTSVDSNGKTTTHTRRVRETEWWPLEGKHHRYYNGYLVTASQSISQRESDSIQPYNLPALKRYQPYFLAGWLSEEATLDKKEAVETTKDYFYQQERKNIGLFLPGDTYSQLQVATDFSKINSDLCLLPVYVHTYHFQGKTFRFLINGQTGQIAGQKPYSYAKTGILVTIIAAILFLIYLFFIFYIS
ncbi:MAG: zinc ribbon domain-containing protein [Pirellulaceae bacterium]|nr:zinc ribbon domain-containing protein [Pirellulaceae bacterium]